MSGSLDDHKMQIVDTRETLLAVLVYPDGSVKLQSCVRLDDGSTNHAWVADTLRKVAEREEQRANDATGT